jgi:hypothetical protein
MSTTGSGPVVVNFEVSIAADSSLTVIGGQAPSLPANLLVPSVNLPVNALYDVDTSAGLIEIWEPTADEDNIHVRLADYDASAEGGQDFTGKYKTHAVQLVKGLQRILGADIDCSAATPFNQYTSDEDYYSQADFARVALAAIAHDMFGHVNATAAIQNDMAFVKNMLSLDGPGADAAATEDTGRMVAGEGGALRYAAYKGAAIAEADVDGLYSATGSKSDANLAKRLVAEILKKGMSAPSALSTSNVNAAATDSLANIAKQVLEQSPARANNVDGSQRDKDHRIALRFYENDVIFMKIKVLRPDVSFTTVGGAQNATGLGLAALYGTEQEYTLKITLGPKEEL